MRSPEKKLSTGTSRAGRYLCGRHDKANDAPVMVAHNCGPCMPREIRSGTDATTERFQTCPTLKLRIIIWVPNSWTRARQPGPEFLILFLLPVPSCLVTRKPTTGRLLAGQIAGKIWEPESDCVLRTAKDAFKHPKG